MRCVRVRSPWGEMAKGGALRPRPLPLAPQSRFFVVVVLLFLGTRSDLDGYLTLRINRFVVCSR